MCLGDSGVCLHVHFLNRFVFLKVLLCLPAAVVVGTPLQKASGVGQPHTGEGVIVTEPGVRQAGQSIRFLIVDVLPVGLQARSAGGERSKQEGVQLVDDLLADAGLKLSGEEGGSGRLLRCKKGNEMKTDL